MTAQEIKKAFFEHFVDKASATLEEEITASVERFMEHEQAVYAVLSPEQALAIATTYPQLQSNELVQSQVQTYREKKEQIVRLKMQKVNASIKRWWLYFGD